MGYLDPLGNYQHLLALECQVWPHGLSSKSEGVPGAAGSLPLLSEVAEVPGDAVVFEDPGTMAPSSTWERDIQTTGS